MKITNEKQLDLSISVVETACVLNSEEQSILLIAAVLADLDNK